MTSRQPPWFALTLLEQCGGGNDAAPVHEAAASAMRAHATAVTRASAVAPDEAARQLMDYAESVAAFKVFFPEHQATSTFGPFTGFALSKVHADGQVGEYWFLRAGPLLLFATYFCEKQDIGKEKRVVMKALASLRID